MSLVDRYVNNDAQIWSCDTRRGFAVQNMFIHIVKYHFMPSNNVLLLHSCCNGH